MMGGWVCNGFVVLLQNSSKSGALMYFCFKPSLLIKLITAFYSRYVAFHCNLVDFIFAHTCLGGWVTFNPDCLQLSCLQV
jgi:hypothetical protein